ncbi:MAG: YqeG family HAD IIIA-type phosphatase [Ruthenibacterium sp.]
MPLFMPTVIFKRITAITPSYLQAHGIKALVLDVDNTLTGHGSQVLPPDVAAWIIMMRTAGVRMVIASNNFPQRVAPFAAQIDLPFCAFCCKPSPTGFVRARKKLGVCKNEMALVGDQIFTDALGANLYGIPVLLVQPMYTDTKATIKLKRFLEKPFLSRYYKRGGKLL